MITLRASGILLHPTSLPGPFGAGDFGADAYKFVDWLKAAGQTYWQVLPMGEIGPGNSPYMSSSAFAGSILLIDLIELAEHGWLNDEDLAPNPHFHSDHVNYAPVKEFRLERLRCAAKQFFASSNKIMHQAFTKFCELEKKWLHDYALFMAIAKRENWRDWSLWPHEIMHRDAQTLHNVGVSCAGEIAFWKFCQWSFFRQWSKLKHYANEQGVLIIGDVPIFVALQSADVWAHQELFELDINGKPLVVAGVPPDYFSKTGQLWGNPLYRWVEHEKSGYKWWIYRIKKALQLADLVRIDHFRGFASYWEVQADALNAIHGKWMPGPKEKLFNAFEAAFPSLPIIAEDLGMITPDVIELRDQFKLPGMRVLQFAFGEDESNHFLPHHYIPNTVAYTGTHDNDTTIGWWSSLPAREKTFAQQYLSCDGQNIQWDMMRALSNSQANTVIYPMQDVLGLSSICRMNHPGQPEGNWEWRFTWSQVYPEQTHELLKMSAEHHRVADVTALTVKQ